MNNGIVKHEDSTAVVSGGQVGQVGGFVASLDAHWRLANMLVRSGMLPKALNTPDAAMAVMLKAHEIGIPYMFAFANLHYFDGKLVESAALMAGMAADRCGVTYEVVEWTDERCELLFHRPGWKKPLPSVFTMDDAKRARLTGKDNWQKYPKGMLLARAQSQGVRAIAPDRFGGMYSAEEVRDFDDRSVEAASAAVSDLNAALDDEPKRIEPAVEDAEVVNVPDLPPPSASDEEYEAAMAARDGGELPFD